MNTVSLVEAIWIVINTFSLVSSTLGVFVAFRWWRSGKRYPDAAVHILAGGKMRAEAVRVFSALLLLAAGIAAAFRPPSGRPTSVAAYLLVIFAFLFLVQSLGDHWDRIKVERLG